MTNLYFTLQLACSDNFIAFNGPFEASQTMGDFLDTNRALICAWVERNYPTLVVQFSINNSLVLREATFQEIVNSAGVNAPSEEPSGEKVVVMINVEALT